jgi:cytochrome c oxidase cbb3-type subunit III
VLTLFVLGDIMNGVMRTGRACVLTLGAAALFAQTPADIDNGGRLFQNTCTVCHGPDGDQVAGIDLGHLKFRRASNDQDVIKFIREGVPGTGMPANNMTEQQAGTIIAYLRSLATDPARKNALAGDAIRGKSLFEGKGGCLSCHRVKGNGSRLGPDLSDIGSLRRVVQLETSILEPDAEILPQNRFYRVVTKDGQTVTGRLLNQDTFTVQIFDSKDQLRSFMRSNLKESAFIDKSPMPSFQGKLSAQEVADVVSYLTTLRGVDK